MSFDFHKDKDRYFRMQQENAERAVIPFIEEQLPLKKGMRVLEIGCAEGGVLQAFLDRGCIGYGVELHPGRYEMAKVYLSEALESGQAQLIRRDIYEVDVEKEMPEKFDLIILKDVIEHIFDQDKIMKRLRDFLVDGGMIFFGFPPWQMPFGGHQQIAKNKWLGKLPYYHLLPRPIYKSLLKACKESDKVVEELLEIKETGISIERFERILKHQSYSIENRRFYLFNPIYEYKFKLKARKQLGIIAAIPWFRNFVTTCMFYLVQKR